MQDLKVTPVVQMGDIAEKDIAGYYYINARLPANITTPNDRASQIAAPIFFFIMNLELNHVPKSQLEEALIRTNKPLHSKIYLFPHAKDEKDIEAVKKRVLFSPKTMRIGYFESSKINWCKKQPKPLSLEYTTESTMSAEAWKETLRQSPLVRFVALYDSLPISTPRELVMCDFIPEQVALTPHELAYQKGNRKFKKVTTTEFAQKVSGNRGFTWEYTNRVVGPKYLFDKIFNGKFKDIAVSIPGVKQDFFLDPAMDLAGHEIPAGIQMCGSEKIKEISAMHEYVFVQKVNGLGAFGVSAKKKIQKGWFLGMYSGDFCDDMVPREQSVKDSFLTSTIEGVLPFSWNQAFYSYKRGNYVGLMNHASEEECNVGVTYANYKGLLVLVYYARKDIDSLAPLLVNYVDSRTHENRKFPEQESNLSFTKSHAVVFDKAASAMATKVYEQGVAFFKAGKLPEAKRAFKQAVGLTENAPDANLEKAQFQRSLGTTYFKLLDLKETKDKTKYTSRAKFFLEAAQKHPEYVQDKEVARKLAVLNK